MSPWPASPPKSWARPAAPSLRASWTRCCTTPGFDFGAKNGHVRAQIRSDSARTMGATRVNVQETQQAETYLKRLFGNQRLRVVPQKVDTVNVLVGEDNIGDLSVDDEDEERSYNLRMEIPLGDAGGIADAKRLDAYLKRKFDNERIRVVARPKKQDSVEAYIGDEFIAVLFLDDSRAGRSYIFEMPILGIDLQPGGAV